MMRCLILSMAVIFLLSACANANHADSDSEVQKTWNDAYVSLPGGTFGYMKSPRVQAALAANPARPVIIFIHGCNGLSGPAGLFNYVSVFAEKTNEAGYIFVAPDSFVRLNRPHGCPGGKLNLSARNIDWATIDQMRLEEIYYSVSQVKHAPWAADVFLFGQSEGGKAVTGYEAADVNGIVVSGWGCPPRDDSWTLTARPIKAPTSVPVLNIKSRKDEVDPRPDDCGSSVWGRPGGSKVINPPYGHWFMDHAEYRQEVILFFGRNQKSSAQSQPKQNPTQ